jgi:Zn-finger nucleic acid-binding protein
MKLLLDRQHFYCEYCTSICFPEENQDGVRILDEDSQTLCPVCEIPLVYGYVNQTQTLCCKKCMGMLIDQDIFLLVINYLRTRSTQLPIIPPAVNLQEMNRELYCPDCGRLMSTHLYGGPGNLVVDNCVHCNLLWLDHTEFRRVVRAPGRERLVGSEVDEQE